MIYLLFVTTSLYGTQEPDAFGTRLALLVRSKGYNLRDAQLS